MKNSLIDRLDVGYDTKRIASDWSNIRNQLTDDHWWNESQMMVQHKGSPHYTDGCGTAYNLNESEYVYTNPLFQDTIFEEILKDHKGYRARILKMAPKTVYSLHQDLSRRMHLVIKTNHASFFLFPRHNQTYVLSADGHIYDADTTQPHTYINADMHSDRIHMVFCI